MALDISCPSLARLPLFSTKGLKTNREKGPRKKAIQKFVIVRNQLSRLLLSTHLQMLPQDPSLVPYLQPNAAALIRRPFSNIPHLPQTKTANTHEYYSTPPTAKTSATKAESPATKRSHTTPETHHLPNSPAQDPPTAPH
jgi:hypothetical protein